MEGSHVRQPKQRSVQSRRRTHSPTGSTGADGTPAMLFDLDGTLVDSVYQHVLSWQEALDEVGIRAAE